MIMNSVLLYTEGISLIFLAMLVHAFGYYLIGCVFGVSMKRIDVFASWGFHVFSSHDRWFVCLFPKMRDRIEFRIGWLPVTADVRFTEPLDEQDKSENLKENLSDGKDMLLDFAGVLANMLVGLMLLGFLSATTNIDIYSFPYIGNVYGLHFFAVVNLLLAVAVGVMIIVAHCIYGFVE